MSSVHATPRDKTVQGAREAERREVEREAYVAVYAALVAAGCHCDEAAREGHKAAKVAADEWVGNR